MSSYHSISTGGPPSPRTRRAAIRHATWVDPQTAAKSRRTFSLSLESRDQEGPPPPFIADIDSPTLPTARQEQDFPRARLAWLEGRSDKWERIKIFSRRSRAFVFSDVGKNMLKCALAYSLGSMATFIPAVSGLFGRQDSKHLVATITVYFHPARSFGSMLDASVLASIAFLYTAVVSIVSMSVSVLFTDILHLVALGHAVILLFFVGGGLGFIGWIKLKKGDPLVNVACSLTSLSLITVLTKEGAVQEGNYSFVKVYQILRMIIAGVICTMAVSFLVLPSSGRLNLKRNMTEVSDTLSDMLGLITKSFISGDEHDLEDLEYVAISERYKKSSGKVAQNLKEARYEHFFFGHERLVVLEGRIAQCLERIGQSVGGLRSAAAMQFAISKQPGYQANLQGPRPGTSSSLGQPGPAILDNEGEEHNSDESDMTLGGHTERVTTPHQIFELFIDCLGPSMRSLAYTMKEILDDLPFDPDEGYRVSNNPRFRASLDKALDLYKNARREALSIIYDKKDLEDQRPLEVEADWEEAAACCGHFSFSLLEVADQIKEFLTCLDDLEVEMEDNGHIRSWSWLRFWHRKPDLSSSASPELAHAPRVDDQNTLKDLPNLDTRPSRPNQIWLGSNKSRWKQLLFHYLHQLRSILAKEDNKFAIKVGFGAMIYALPAYISSTRSIYTHYRGEWGLLSYMLVCSMTIGASNTTGYQRFIGTALGAVLALIAWNLSHGNPVLLTCFGFLMSYYTSYIIIGQNKGPMGRFIMLTYNLSALYAYSLTMADDPNDADEEDPSGTPLIYQIAAHRVIAVLSGCIWGLIITRLVWPISARQKLKDGISLLWLRMGLTWKRDPLAIFTEGESPTPYLSLREENELQRFLSKLQGLTDASRHEFDLRRPFPHAAYDRILKSTARMLEAFHAMNVVIQKDLQPSPGELALLQVTQSERAELCARLSYHFSVLASSMKFECSIAGVTSTDARGSDSVPGSRSVSNNIAPSSVQTRDRLLAKVFAYRKDDSESQKTRDEDYGLLYTYALVTGQLGQEIRACFREVEELFGVLDEEVLMLQ